MKRQVRENREFVDYYRPKKLVKYVNQCYDEEKHPREGDIYLPVYRTVFFILFILFNLCKEELAVSQIEETYTKVRMNREDKAELETADKMEKEQSTYLTEDEALDLVKTKYAANFIKVYREDGKGYYYKLDVADYYLVCEGLEEDRYYLIHLYEFVVDEEASGLGHTVTYGWYAVDRQTGLIEERMGL